MLRSITAAAATAFVCAVALAATGCTRSYIPNTDVEDTGENKAVIMFCERYRHAVEDKNVSELLKLASPGYFQISVKNEDVYDFNGLRQYLTETFERTTGIRYEIRYRRVTYTDTNHIFVDFTYAAAFRIPGVKGDEWRHKVADDRLDIVRDKDDYRIVSGM
jgi:hypothetical protein